MEQLFIVVLIIAFSLGDVVLRWLKKRNAGSPQDRTPPGWDDPTDNEMEQEPDWGELLRRQREREDEAMIFFPREEAPAPAPVEEAPRRPIPVESTAPARGLAGGGRLPQPKPIKPRVVPVRQWLRSPTDARKGIVLMNVLGPCKGLE